MRTLRFTKTSRSIFFTYNSISCCFAKKFTETCQLLAIYANPPVRLHLPAFAPPTSCARPERVHSLKIQRLLRHDVCSPARDTSRLRFSQAPLTHRAADWPFARSCYCPFSRRVSLRLGISRLDLNVLAGFVLLLRRRLLESLELLSSLSLLYRRSS